MTQALSLTSYRLLGRSGLRVSPLCLGAMTFGSDWGWGAELHECRRIFDEYLERGGNFVDTANQYTSGSSEQFLGELVEGRRDRIVIATKYTLASRPDDPNSGGNHRKSMIRSIETSLRRMKTDYIDLFYLHAWDGTTSVEEIMRAMDDLVRAGKVLYLGISDTAAWQVSRMQAIADLRGWSPLVALQIEYSLVERTVERELIPMAREMGLGVISWSPLGSGVLTGKYTMTDLQPHRNVSSDCSSRRQVMLANGLLTKQRLAIADVVKEVAMQVGRSPAQVALAWTLLNPIVTAPILGARTLEQLRDNLGALSVELSDSQRARLAEASAVHLGFPHDFLARLMNSELMGTAYVARCNS